MRSNRWSLQRALTWLGLALLAGALVVVAANLLLRLFPEGNPIHPLWMALKVLIAGVLLVSWVFLNIPEVKAPTGPFVLAIAQFGELQSAGVGWEIVPGQRSLGDQARELLPDPVVAFLDGQLGTGDGAGPERPPWLSWIDSRISRPAPPSINGRGHEEETAQLPRQGEREVAAIHRPPLGAVPGPPGGGNTTTLARPAAETIREAAQATAEELAPLLPPEPLPERAPAATEWLFNTLRRRWNETGVTGIVPTVVDFAPDAATARALAAAIPADAALWGVVRGGSEPAVWSYIELRTNLEGRAQSDDVELHMAGLTAFPLAPITPRAPEVLLSMLTGLAYYAAGRYQDALNEWNLTLITAIIAHDNPPETPLSAVAVAHFYRGNASYLMNSQHLAAKAYEAALAVAPRLAEAHHNLGLVYHAQGRLDEAREKMERTLALNPRLELARYNLGVVLLTLNQLDEAAGIFRELIARNPANAAAHRALGRVYQANKQPDLAERELREALNRRSDYFDVHLDLAGLYYRLAAQYPDDQAQQEQAQEVSPRRQLLDQAAAELRQALGLRPNSLDAHYNFGLVLYEEHELEDAADEFREVIRLRGDFHDARAMLDLVFRSQGPSNHELMPFREPTALQPANAATFITLGLDEYEEKHYTEAVEKFERALHLEPRNGEAHFQIGRTLARLNDARAIGHLQEALRSPRPPDEAAHELAAIYRQQNRLDDAVRVLQEQIGRNPADAQALYVVGTIYAHRKHLDEAIDFFRTAIRYNPNLAPAHYNLGVAYTAKNRLYDALTEFERLVELTPRDAQAHCVLGVAYKDLRNYTPAMQELEKAVQLKPDYVEALYNLGLVYQALDQPEKALLAFRDALHLNPTHQAALYRQGVTYAALGQIDAAIGVFQRVVDANPQMAEAHFNLGVAYQSQHNHAGAVREFQAVVQLRPSDAEAFNNLGLAYRQVGRIEEAIAAFRRAVALKPDYAQAYYNLGNAYTAINEINQAIQAFSVYDNLAK